MLPDAWRLAVGTLTAWPVTAPRVVDRRRAGLAMLLAPVAALPLGMAVGLVVACGVAMGTSPLVAGLLGVGLVVLGTRAMHVDGLSDTADGLTASYDRERSLAVMKGGTAGPAGVAAVVLILLLQAAGLAGLVSGGSWRAGVVAGLAVCVSRCALVLCCVRGVPPARPGGLGQAFTESVSPWAAAAVWAASAGLVSAAGWWAEFAWWRGGLAVLLAVLAVAIVVRRALARFGGVTGDVFGASIEIALATLLVILS